MVLFTAFKQMNGRSFNIINLGNAQNITAVECIVFRHLGEVSTLCDAAVGGASRQQAYGRQPSCTSSGRGRLASRLICPSPVSRATLTPRLAQISAQLWLPPSCDSSRLRPSKMGSRN